MRFRPNWLSSVLLLLTLAFPLHAERYALLIGVGRYLNGIHGLDGPAFDIEAVRTLLLRNGYKPADIGVLADEKATRPRILENLRAIVAKLKSGDHLLLYYSGHGTSAFDSKLQWLSPAIGPDSGALATYDLSLANISEAAETLVIGRRDLRPILSHVPQGARALVVLDACYSENSAKSVSIFRDAPVRGLNLVEAIKDQTTPAEAHNSSVQLASGSERGTYPYDNVVALSAASKDQPAIDINEATMKNKPDWRTVDGKPHGALTNTLLEALSGQADTNHDGVISYDEMFRYLRRRMERYPHQPQLLSAPVFPLNEPALGGSPGSGARTPHAPLPPDAAAAAGASGRLRVAMEGSDSALSGQLQKEPFIEVVTTPFDILLRKDGAEWGIYDPSGVLIQKMPSEPAGAIVARLQVQAKLTQLRLWSNPRQTFNVRIDAEPEAGDSYDKARTVFRIGEKVRFRISTEQPAFLLLLGIDKDGRVTVLFPGPPEKEHGLQSANQGIEFAVTATPPAGSEQLKLIGFLGQPSEWGEWVCSKKACPSFSPTDPRMSRLIEMLNRSGDHAAETSIRVITR